jgi:hypothetical protein
VKVCCEFLRVRSWKRPVQHHIKWFQRVKRIQYCIVLYCSLVAVSSAPYLRFLPRSVCWCMSSNHPLLAPCWQTSIFLHRPYSTLFLIDLNTPSCCYTAKEATIESNSTEQYEAHRCPTCKEKTEQPRESAKVAQESKRSDEYSSTPGSNSIILQ